MITDALIGQDIHTWERKSLINERFFKMQHLASRLNDRIKDVQGKMTRWIEDIMKRTYEHSRRIELDSNDKIELLTKNVNNNQELLTGMIDRMNLNVTKNKKEAQENHAKVLKNMQTMKKDFKQAMTSM